MAPPLPAAALPGAPLEPPAPELAAPLPPASVAPLPGASSFAPVPLSLPLEPPEPAELCGVLGDPLEPVAANGGGSCARFSSPELEQANAPAPGSAQIKASARAFRNESQRRAQGSM